MRSRKNYTINSQEVHGYAKSWLSEKLIDLKDHGPKCTQSVILEVLLLAAARLTSIFDVCKDLSKAPTGRAVRDALLATLPAIVQLEKELNQSLCIKVPRSLTRRKRPIAVDLTLLPYHGQPYEDEKEIYRGQAKSGTSHFHAYATAYVVHRGFHYTLAVSRVERGEKMDEVLKRLLPMVRDRGVRIEYLLLDRGFFSANVIRYLRRAHYPYLMPVAFRGKAKRDAQGKFTGLRAFLKKRNGWYTYQHTGQDKGKVNIDICVASRAQQDQKTNRKRFKKLVYTAWRVKRSPEQIREDYRRRFGIETRYRQMNQARIRTCTRNPLLRLLYVGIALILVNVWVWLHYTFFAERGGLEPTLHLEKLRFKTMLRWIAQIVERTLHNGELHCVEVD